MNAPIDPPKFYDFRFGMEPLAIMGRLRAFGTRILCRAILDTDYNAAQGGQIHLVQYNSVEAAAFVVLSVGGGVAKKCAEMGEECPRPGQIIDVRSVAADRVNAKDALGRYWLVDVADVSGITDPVEADAEGLFEACREVHLRGDAMSIAAAPTGEIELATR